MSFLETNSSNISLSANETFRGKSTLLNSEYNTANISVSTDVSGVLTVWHSTTGITYSTFDDVFVCEGKLIKQVILKGKYFYLTYKNNSSPQSYLQLLCKLSLNIREGIKVDSNGGGGSGGDVNITGCDITLPVNVISGFATETTLAAIDTKLSEELSVNVISGFATETTLAAIDTKLSEELSVNVISGFATETTLGAIDTKLAGELAVNVISGFATETTLNNTYDLLNDNIGTGGLSVILTALDGEKITNTVIDTMRGLDVNIINSPSVDISGQIVNIGNNLNVNVLETNSTIYDLTDNGPTLTGADSRYESDRNRPDSWAYTNVKSQLGSSLYWYANSSTSPQGAQEFNITQGMINTLYSVVSINKTADADALPIMGLYSPSNVGFYTSRWIYTIDPSELLLQNEKVLLYYGTNPIDIYPNLRHIQLLFNAVASQGPLLSSEIVYLMSLNAPSAMAAGAISYNIYNTGFVLNNGIQNDYEFNSGIKSKGDLLLSKLSVSDSTNLNVNVSNTLGVSVSNTVDVANTNLDQLTFDMIDSKPTKGLNVIVRNTYLANITEYALADISSNDLPTIDLREFKTLSFFGNSTHVGTGSHNIIVQFSIDGITFYNSPYLIATNASGNFAWDYKDFCVPYIRMQFQVTVTALTAFVCLK